MKPYLIDVPVLLIFFARPDTFGQVFEQVKKARPNKLFLYQDGARINRPDDIVNVEACRKIAENIDWDCEVHRFYQDKNVGCDPSEFIAIKWMFQSVDKGIILEDDDVPSQSFFPFCKELLEMYESDQRIGMICGLNHINKYNDQYSDYIFSNEGPIWGWATWKRCIDTWDENYTFLNDKYVVEMLGNYGLDKEALKACYRHLKSGKAHYETIHGFSNYLSNRLNIIPTKNLISNIGVGGNTTHSVDNIKLLPHSYRKLVFKKVYELEFPLRHPKYIVRDMKYEKEVGKLVRPTYFVRKSRQIEGLVRRIILGSKNDRRDLLLKIKSQIF